MHEIYLNRSRHTDALQLELFAPNGTYRFTSLEPPSYRSARQTLTHATTGRRFVIVAAACGSAGCRCGARILKEEKGAR